MLGAAYYRTGDYKSSQVALQQALSLDKSSALSYLLMGCTLAKLGQNEVGGSPLPAGPHAGPEIQRRAVEPTHILPARRREPATSRQTLARSARMSALSSRAPEHALALLSTRTLSVHGPLAQTSIA